MRQQRKRSSTGNSREGDELIGRSQLVEQRSGVFSRTKVSKLFPPNGCDDSLQLESGGKGPSQELSVTLKTKPLSKVEARRLLATQIW